MVWSASDRHTTCRCAAGSGLLLLKLSQHNPAIHLKEQQQASLHSKHLQAPSKHRMIGMRLMMQLSSSSADTQPAQLQVRGLVDSLVDRKRMQSKTSRRKSSHNTLSDQSCTPMCVVSHRVYGADILYQNVYIPLYCCEISRKATHLHRW